MFHPSWMASVLVVAPKTWPSEVSPSILPVVVLWSSPPKSLPIYHFLQYSMSSIRHPVDSTRTYSSFVNNSVSRRVAIGTFCTWLRWRNPRPPSGPRTQSSDIDTLVLHQWEELNFDVLFCNPELHPDRLSEGNVIICDFISVLVCFCSL
jgi:hypothetical protein